MRITYKGDYAVKTMLGLALNYGSVVSIHDLAKQTDAPVKFLEQVLLDLKRGGFVESRRGKVGGYLLARPPEQIRLGEVVRFIDGPIEPIACVAKKYSGCRDISKCVLRGVWQEVAECTSGIIDQVNFGELANRAKKQEATEAYQI